MTEKTNCKSVKAWRRKFDSEYVKFRRYLWQNNISLKFSIVTGNAENWHGCQFSNVTSDMHANEIV